MSFALRSFVFLAAAVRFAGIVLAKDNHPGSGNAGSNHWGPSPSPPSPPNTPSSDPDYVIVGGGSAGLVLANRLTEDPNVRVLVIEGGGNGVGNVNISDIKLIGAAWGTSIDWSTPSEPLKYANNRVLNPTSRGKVLGGSSAINGDVLGRGDNREYDMWETLGNSGWNSKSITAGVVKGEKFTPPARTANINYNAAAHGYTGNFDTSYANPAPSIHNDIISSVKASGGSESTDFASGTVKGVAHVTNSRDPATGARSTSATGYYFPIWTRKNLQVLLYSTVTKIVWSSTGKGDAVAKGVEYVDGFGKTQTVTAKTVILSAGTYGSPPILERSGIGSASFLKSVGINSVVDLPGVGENLQDQTFTLMEWALNSTIPLDQNQPFLLNMESAQTTLGSKLNTAKQMMASSTPGLSSQLGNANRDLFNQGVPWTEEYIALINAPSSPTVLTVYLTQLHPLSRGSVHVRSSQGTQQPKIEYNFYQHPFDLYMVAASAQRAQQVMGTPPFSKWIASPITPSASTTSIDDLQAWARENVMTINHAMGTALMSPRNAGGVVDPNLKVYGTQNVYVVDASVIPIEPSAHLLGTVYGLAENAANLFKGRH